MIDRRKLILGVPVDALDLKSAREIATQHLEQSDRPGYILAVNPEKVNVLSQDDELREFFASALMLLPDGIGVVAALRLAGCRAVRIAGADFFLQLCSLACQTGRSVFLYGASEEVNTRAAEVLSEQFPGLKIAGRANGYVAESEMPRLVERINSSGAAILFVALGSPRQELWVKRFRDDLSVALIQCVGGTLDVMAGRVRRAPYVFRRLGLEWLYRLALQPQRIGRQLALPMFAARALREAIGNRTGVRSRA